MDGQFFARQPIQFEGRGYTRSGPLFVNSATSGATNGSPANVSLPSSLVSGNLLVVTLGYAQNANLTTPAGWTHVGTANSVGTTGANRKVSVFSKISDALEGSTLAITQTGTPSNWGGTAFQITNATTASMAGSFVDTSGGEPDPPNLDMLTSASTLWIVGAIKRQSPLFSAAPSGYSDLQTILGGASNMSWASAWKKTTAQTDDPGTYTGSTISDSWAAVTIGVR